MGYDYRGQYVRHGTYPIEQVIALRVSPKTPKQEAEIIFDGKRVLMNSQRYEVFDVKGVKCATCGIEGRYFALEIKEQNLPKDDDKRLIALSKDRYHFNLYAVKEDGTEELMTKDHIIPRSKGGKDELDNYQTMCHHCNCIIKGDKM